MSDMAQGLTISVVGILITFFSLGVFILIMVLLQRIFPAAAKQVEEAEEDQAAMQVELDQEGEIIGEDQAAVAAIMVAIKYFQTESQPVLGINLEAGRGRWWTSNRMIARQPVLMKKN